MANVIQNKLWPIVDYRPILDYLHDHDLLLDEYKGTKKECVLRKEKEQLSNLNTVGNKRTQYYT